MTPIYIALSLALCLVGIAVLTRRGPPAIETRDRAIPDLPLGGGGGGRGGGQHDASERVPVEATDNGGWRLNPGAQYPITVRGIPERTCQDLRDALDDGTRGDVDAYRQRIFDIVSGRAFVWDELDAYVAEHGPAYEAEVERRLAAAPGHATATPRTRAAQEAQARREAVSELSVRPACNLDALLSCASAGRTYVPPLVARYGYRTLDSYLSRADPHHRALVVKTGSDEDTALAALVRSRLAIVGSDVPLGVVLETLSEDTLRELSRRLDGPDAGSRQQLAAFLIEARGAATAVAVELSGQEVYQLLSLPEDICDPSRVDIADVAVSWRYAQEVVTLLCITHRAAQRSQDSVRRITEHSVALLGWEIVPGPGTSCPLARTQRDLPHPGTDPPVVPLHIGCTCELRPLIPDDTTTTDILT